MTIGNGNGQIPEEGPVDPQGMSLAAALWSFEDKLISGEEVDSEEILCGYPEKKGEIEGMLSLLYWGKEVLAPSSPSGAQDGAPSVDGPCRPGAVLGSYRIVREIGRGGMGIVYEAEQLPLGRTVALKVLPRVLGLESAGLKRFEREARLAAVLHHTNIVPIHDFGVDQGVAYYSMEIIAGPPLSRALDDLRSLGGPPVTAAHLSAIGGALEHDGDSQSGVAEGHRTPALAYARKAAWLLAGVAEGLHAAHQRGIIHRDIKPGNLLSSGPGRLVITDFGVACMREVDAVTTDGRSIGTPHYMSPEQARARRIAIDHRTDIFSLGVTLYEMLTLRLPFTGRSAREVLDRIAGADPPSIRRANPRVPEDLEAIVLRALEKAPARRYATALELANDLRRFVLGQPTVARRPGLGRRISRRLARNWRKLGVLLAFLAVAALGTAGYVELRETRLELRETRAAALVHAAEAILRGEPIDGALHPRGTEHASPPLQAAACLDEALRLVPSDGRAHFLRGNANLEEGRLEDAVADFTRAIELSSHVAPAYFRRGTVREALGLSREAAADIATAKEIAPRDGLLLFYEGVSAQAEGDIPEAIDLFRRALEASPALRPEAFYRLAQCHYGQEDHDQAVACLRVVVGLRPRWLSPLALLAYTGFQKGDPEVAGEVVRVLQESFPPCDDARALLALCLELQGDRERARRARGTLAGPAPEQRAQAEILTALLRSDQVAEEAVIRGRLDAAPSDVMALHWLGDLRRRQDRREEALDAFRTAARSEGPAWSGLVEAGQELIELERPEEAIEILEEACARRKRALAHHGLLSHHLCYPMERLTLEVELGSTLPRLARPGDGNPRVPLGEAYRLAGRLEESLSILEAAAVEHPRSPLVRDQMGFTLYSLGRAEAAIVEMERARRLGHDNASMHAALATLLRDTGRVEESRQVIDELGKMEGGGRDAMLLRARLELSSLRLEEAIAVCREGLLAGASPWSFHAILGRAAKELGRRDEARAAFEEAARTAPGWALPHFELALLAREEGRAADAEGLLRTAIECSEAPPERGISGASAIEGLPRREALHTLGDLLAAQGRTEEARAAFGRMLGAEPDSSAILAELAKHLAKSSRGEEALREADACVERNPRDAGMLLARAQARFRASRGEDALRDLEHAVELSGRSPETRRALAQGLLASGKAERGEEVLRAAIESFPGDVLLSRILSDHLARRGRHREAIAVLRRAVEAPGARPDPESRNDLAWWLLTASDASCRDPRAALPLARQAAEEAPSNPSILNSCGLAFLRNGSPREARDCLRRADWLHVFRTPTSTNRGENLLLLAIAEARLGEVEAAKKALEDGMRLAPGSAFTEEARSAVAGSSGTTLTP